MCFDALLQQKDIFGTVRCSPIYWTALLGLYPFVALALWASFRSLRDLARFHELRGEAPIEGDPIVTVRKGVGFACLTLLVGLLAGILGLGGGEFMVPLLLEFGLLPRVASATSGFLIVFSTSNNIIHYLIAGSLEPYLGYAIGCLLVANLGAFVGLMLRDTKYMRDNSYLVVFTLAALLYASCGLLVYQSLMEAAPTFEFGSFCG